MLLAIFPFLSALVFGAQAAPFPQATARPPSLTFLDQQSIPLNNSASLVGRGYEVGDVTYFPSSFPSCGGEQRPAEPSKRSMNADRSCSQSVSLPGRASARALLLLLLSR
jgi:hypothetical protein